MDHYQIFNTDCINFLASLKARTVDLILTDPPYNLGEFVKKRNANFHSYRSNHFSNTIWDDHDYLEWTDLMHNFLKESARILKKGGSLVTFMSVIRVETVIGMAEKYGFYYKTTGVWHKTNPIPRNMNLHFINSIEVWIYFVYDSKVGTFNNDGFAHHDFIELPVTNQNEKKLGSHPTQKPISLMEYFIKLGNYIPVYTKYNI